MKKGLLKKTFLSIFVFISFLTIFLSIVFLSFLNFISQKTGQNSVNLLLTTFSAINENSFQNKDRFNFMILGLDKRDDALEKTETTDTIIFSSLNFNDQKLNLTSLPRDIWDYELNTKINSIYPLALKSENTFPFIESNFSDLTGQKIERTIIITTDSLIDFVNLIGGVDVNLEKGFIDKQYPNPDYIKNPSPKIPIYKTVEFKAGRVHLDETNVTEFVRSRKGGETAETGGTDIGRIERQQLLINAVISKIKSKEFISDYNNIFKLYSFWHKEIDTNISDADLLSILLKLNKNINNITLNKTNVPIGNTKDDGVIYHPIKFINKQWVFTTSDENYSKLHDFIYESLN
jgi:LCP family protein required for cell wall assembly